MKKFSEPFRNIKRLAGYACKCKENSRIDASLKEPINQITRQYNQSMKDILPDFGIDFFEIPRKYDRQNLEVISASRVRKYIEENRWEEIYKIVPKTTYKYLCDNYRTTTIKID